MNREITKMGLGTKLAEVFGVKTKREQEMDKQALELQMRLKEMEDKYTKVTKKVKRIKTEAAAVAAPVEIPQAARG